MFISLQIGKVCVCTWRWSVINTIGQGMVMHDMT